MLRIPHTYTFMELLNTATQKELLQGFPEPYSDDDDNDYDDDKTRTQNHVDDENDEKDEKDENDENDDAQAQQQQIINIFLANLDTHTDNYNIKKFRQFVKDNKKHPKMHKNNLNRKHYKPNKYLPIPIFEGDIIKTGFIYHDKLNHLKNNDILELYKIGNPLIKETEGGLTLANIYKNIHNNKLGKTLDSGRNLSNGIIRIWSIINQ